MPITSGWESKQLFTRGASKIHPVSLGHGTAGSAILINTMSTVTIKGKTGALDAPVRLEGSVQVPASKSHTIRALLIASLASGKSRIRRPLYSADTLSCLEACRKLGAVIEDREDGWEVVSPIPFGEGSDVYIDVGNSGTSLYLLTAIAAALGRKVNFDGDEQIRRRSADRLLNALKDLGVEVESAENGCAPYWVKGPLQEGECSIECPTSQYLSALLLAAPLLPLSSQKVRIKVPLLMEQPYAEMTLKWMEKQRLSWEQDEMREFVIPGGQGYSSFDEPIAADFSSATFFFCA
ncbi:MAG: hypothetical protein PQJ50_18315, partial [Spirochaetales bacterium]|nr:hypothetical protein [Spirochaetales bacterium]